LRRLAYTPVDSACVLPSISLGPEIIDQIRSYTKAIARELNVIGLMNIQYAVKGWRYIYAEVNPRASRTVPFVSKATGVSLARLATKVIMGCSLKELDSLKRSYLFMSRARSRYSPLQGFWVWTQSWALR
jgi:carbamoyl-phosphate synthase large subunit